MRVARIFNTYGPRMHMYDGTKVIDKQENVYKFDEIYFVHRSSCK